MHYRSKIYSLFICLSLLVFSARAQLTIRGTVYDSTKIIPVKDVVVKSGCGTITQTDSLGRYEIVTGDQDSITFIYQNKNTAKFAVRQIQNIGDFNISLHVRVNEKFKTMKEVRVFGKSFKQDSIENRMAYAKIFNYEKPGVSSSTSSYSGTPGLDLDEFINIFRFRRNKQLAHMQKRLEEEEKEKYIDYRFNKISVKRITGLSGKELDDFMLLYRPDYEFTVQSSTVDFYQYILNCSYSYKKQLLKQQLKPDQP